jgi:ribosome biogenesis GTPase
MHLNKYEYIKKNGLKYKEKKINKQEKIEACDSNQESYLVIESKYHSAILLVDGEEIEYELLKSINSPLNKIIFVGDRVTLLNNKIDKLIERKNLLCRYTKDGKRIKDTLDAKVIATNIDIIFIVASFASPEFHPRFVDRYLLLAHYNNIKPIIIINKYDLKTEEEEKLLKIYEDSGEEIILTSTIDNFNIDKIKEFSKDKSVILVGNSGVGKSSLISKIIEKDLKVNDVSTFSNRGKHTTTSSKIYEWKENSYVIDTPGIRALDISFIPKEEIKKYFKEFDNYECKYRGCMHDKEDGCSIKKAVQAGNINKERYESYLRLI